MSHKGDITVLRQLKNSAMSVWMVILPGVMRGVSGGGQVTAIERYKKQLIHHFAGVVCVSTGSPTGAFALAEQAEIGTTFYYQECTSTDFIRRRRMFVGGHGVDVGYLARNFREGPKSLRQDRIYAADTELWFGVTEYKSAIEKYIDAKTVQPDIVHGIHASIAMPVLYRDPVFINGVRYNDGAVSCRPMRYALSKKPTGIIVLANCPENHRKSPLKKSLTDLAMLTESNTQRRAMRNSYAAHIEDCRTLDESNVPHLIVYADKEVGAFTRNPQVLKQAAKRSCDHMLSLLNRAGI